MYVQRGSLRGDCTPVQMWTRTRMPASNATQLLANCHPNCNTNPQSMSELLADKYLLANSFGVWRYWRMAYGVART